MQENYQICAHMKNIFQHLLWLIFTCHQLLSAAFSNFRLLTVEMAREDRGYRLRVKQASSRLLGQNLLGL